MLSLTRKVGEKFTIGGNVTVTVLGFKGNQIRIGIDAPREMQIDREEWVDPEETEVLIEYRKAG
jgi:carbon storage regulator